MDAETVSSIIREKHFNKSHNFRLRNEIIKSLNDKLKLFLGVDQPLIKEKKNDYDKRFKVYFWSHEKIILRIH